jgi:hypothetical protein
MDCVLLKFQLALKVWAYVFPVKIRWASYCHKKLIIWILWNFLKLPLKSLPTWIYPSFELHIYLHNTFSPFGVVVAKSTACLWASFYPLTPLLVVLPVKEILLNLSMKAETHYEMLNFSIYFTRFERNYSSYNRCNDRGAAWGKTLWMLMYFLWI